MAKFAATNHVSVALDSPENPDKLNFYGNITLMAWIHPTERNDGGHNIIAPGISSSKTEVFLRIWADTSQVGSWKKDVGTWAAVSTFPAEDVGKWVHICGTYDGTKWTLFRNG